MTHTYIDLRFTDARGHEHVMRAMMDGRDGWLVQTLFHGEPLCRRCDNWQSVERMLSWLRRHAHESAPRPLTHDGLIAAAIGAVMILCGAAGAYAQPTAADAAAVQQFTTATREYAWLHRRIESTLAPLEVTANPETIHRLVQQMAAAVRAARPEARQGDLIGDAVAAVMRRRIADALSANGLTPFDVWAAEAADGVNAAMVPLSVNGPFPWAYATAMFPCLIQALPPLPPELQYRIVGSTLVLVDVHAGLIVDLLPHALADTEL